MAARLDPASGGAFPELAQIAQELPAPRPEDSLEDWYEGCAGQLEELLAHMLAASDAKASGFK